MGDQADNYTVTNWDNNELEKISEIRSIYEGLNEPDRKILKQRSVEPFVRAQAKKRILDRELEMRTRLDEIKGKKYENQDTSNSTLTQESTPIPEGWKLEVRDKPSIKRDDNTVYTFDHDWSVAYKYFKVLWDNHGSVVSYETLYKARDLKYPDKVTKVNSDIRKVLNVLQKEFQDKKLPFEIKINKGASLKIT